MKNTKFSVFAVVCAALMTIPNLYAPGGVVPETGNTAMLMSLSLVGMVMVRRVVR
jgi:hypothetical protein